MVQGSGVRWYDWIAALIVADIIYLNAMLAIFGETFWLQFVGATIVSMIYGLWVDIYCEFRKKMHQGG